MAMPLGSDRHAGLGGASVEHPVQQGGGDQLVGEDPASLLDARVGGGIVEARP